MKNTCSSSISLSFFFADSPVVFPFVLLFYHYVFFPSLSWFLRWVFAAKSLRSDKTELLSPSNTSKVSNSQYAFFDGTQNRVYQLWPLIDSKCIKLHRFNLFMSMQHLRLIGLANHRHAEHTNEIFQTIHICNGNDFS